MTTTRQFFDRQDELSRLTRTHAALKRGEMIIMYGRRRLGKTALVRRFLEEAPGKKAYMFVNTQEEKELMESFSKSILESTGDVLNITSWDSLFDYIHEESSKSRMVLVIDEFQRLKTISPLFITKLQNEWDSRLKDNKLMLILVGSSIGMMHKIALSSTGALYGRKTAETRLRPFRYADFREMFHHLGEEDKIRWYSVFGGTPYYLTLVREAKSLLDAIKESTLNPDSPLREEPKNLLEFELRALSRYNSIMQAIARGKETIKEISDESGMAAENLPKYLDNLEKLMDLIKRKEPLLGKSKSTRYTLSDNFFKFWYRFVMPNQAALELENMKYVVGAIEKDLDSHIERTFEDVVRESFIISNQGRIKDIDLDFTEIGAWWDRTGNEIDLIIKNKNCLIAGEAKWSNKPMDADILHDLIDKKIPLLGHSGRIKTVLASMSGFTKKCQEFASTTHTTLLDINDLKRAFERAGGK